MRREAPATVSYLVLLRDIRDICNYEDWLFEDRAPLLELHFWRTRRTCFSGNTTIELALFDWVTCCTNGLSFKLVRFRYSCSSLLNWANQMQVRAVQQACMMFFAPSAAVDLMYLTATYKAGLEVRYHDLDGIINREAAKAVPRHPQRYHKY